MKNHTSNPNILVASLIGLYPEKGYAVVLTNTNPDRKRVRVLFERRSQFRVLHDEHEFVKLPGKKSDLPQGTQIVCQLGDEMVDGEILAVHWALKSVWMDACNAVEINGKHQPKARRDQSSQGPKAQVPTVKVTSRYPTTTKPAMTPATTAVPKSETAPAAAANSEWAPGEIPGTISIMPEAVVVSETEVSTDKPKVQKEVVTVDDPRRFRVFKKLRGSAWSDRGRQVDGSNSYLKKMLKKAAVFAGDDCRVEVEVRSGVWAETNNVFAEYLATLSASPEANEQPAETSTIAEVDPASAAGAAVVA